MSKRFLTRELIVSEAFRMIDERGTEAFSVRGLASKLGVRASSLYNHIHNEEDLLMEAAKRAAEMYVVIIEDTMKGLTFEEAAYKAGDAFRKFVKEHRYLYELLLDRRWTGGPEVDMVNEKFTRPIYYLMGDGVRDRAESEHIYIAMRVVTHGFLSLESLGVFDTLSVDITESYHMMIKSVLDMMKDMGGKEREDDEKDDK